MSVVWRSFDNECWTRSVFIWIELGSLVRFKLCHLNTSNFYQRLVIASCPFPWLLTHWYALLCSTGFPSVHKVPQCKLPSVHKVPQCKLGLHFSPGSSFSLKKKANVRASKKVTCCISLYNLVLYYLSADHLKCQLWVSNLGSVLPLHQLKHKQSVTC